MRVWVVGFLLAACGGSGGGGGEGSGRFVGEWMIDQPFHAGYEASWYVFRADGRLEHVRDCAYGGPVPTGFVTDASGETSCLFDGTWWAPDHDTLAIDGVCSDDFAREIRLGFPTDAAGNAGGQTDVQVVSVGGETGWVHDVFAWRWTICLESTCEPALAAPACD